MHTDQIRLSKTLSHALRHEPQSYNIALDKEGWVDLSQLINGLRARGWRNLRAEDIVSVVEKSEKKRFQILDGRIRAYYGHSTEEKIIKQPQAPPDVLYHGTSAESVNEIMTQGLLPMSRQYVHLSTDTATAKIVASRRKGSNISILTILARQAYDEGISFYKEENGIWLCDRLLPAYIRL
ncbi:MAG: RNA 2'-phosphotransferase [Williamsia sp.]|nr:RNA 2'-phosphotransferase [Williamsia sp.]